MFSYAKHLIEDTIRRNASPVRDTAGVAGAGSCSSLTSSNSDETHARINRNMAMANQHPYGGMSTVGNYQKGNRNAAGNPLLQHSLSTSDATVGEYKFTVNVGQHSIKITGDSLELVRVSVDPSMCFKQTWNLYSLYDRCHLQISKLVLDEYFTSGEFVPAVEAGEFGLMGSASTSSVTGSASAIPPSHQLNAAQFVDSGVDLNVMAQFGGCQASIDEDEVFNGIFLKLSITQTCFCRRILVICSEFSFRGRCRIEQHRANKSVGCTNEWSDSITPQSLFVGRYQTGLVQRKYQQKKVRRPDFIRK